jgi:hypothetical protein
METKMKAALMLLTGSLVAFAACPPVGAGEIEDRQLAEAMCRDQAGDRYTACVGQQMKNFDCSASLDQAQCEARRQESERCAGLSGWEFRQCINPGELGQPDCSQALDPQRCAEGR